jgi:hypothetical protein
VIFAWSCVRVLLSYPLYLALRIGLDTPMLNALSLYQYPEKLLFEGIFWSSVVLANTFNFMAFSWIVFNVWSRAKIKYNL